MIFNVYFSPTGSTKQVVEQVSKAFDQHIKDIDLSDPNFVQQVIEFSKDDLIILGVPSYSGRMVVLAHQLVEKYLKGNGAKAIIIATYGNRAYDDQLVEMDDLMKQTGFEVIGGISAVCEHSIIRDVAKGRPNDKDLETLKMFGLKIKENMNQTHDIAFPGNRQYKEAKEHFPFIPLTNDSCNGCGTCIKSCITNAIALNDGIAVTKQQDCISCMRCIQVCPQHARMLEENLYGTVKEKMIQNCSDYKEYELFV